MVRGEDLIKVNQGSSRNGVSDDNDKDARSLVKGTQNIPIEKGERTVSSESTL